MNHLVTAILRYAERLPRHARPDERVKLEVVASPMLEAMSDVVRIRATRYLVDRDGLPKWVGCRTHEATVNARVARRGDGALVDAVADVCRYLTNIVCPPPRPKAWRLFGRRPNHG